MPTENPKYIFDTGPFILLKHYPPKTFVSFWEKFDALLSLGQVSSVSEVLRELKPDIMIDWANSHKELFSKPQVEEQTLVSEILRQHPELVKQKNLASGLPVADPFVIAKAKITGAIVVTVETYKPNSHNIPNICEKMGIRWIIGLVSVMEEEGWKF
jgi:Domain of unknown function (DUF4411)